MSSFFMRRLDTSDAGKDLWVEEREDGLVRLTIDFHGNGTREYVELSRAHVQELQGALMALRQRLNKRKAESS